MKSFQNLNLTSSSYLSATLENYVMSKGNYDSGIVISKNSVL